MPSRVVVGMVLYNQVRHLPRALESLLAQTYPHFELVVMDDSTHDFSGQIIQDYSARDSRIHYIRNTTRRGYIDNSRLAFQHAPTPFDYFAWAGDHDAWHPQWLEKLVAVLDAHSDAVLAWPGTVRINDAGQTLAEPSVHFDTTEMSFGERLRVVGTLRRGFGDMVYGLFRADALRRAGVMRRVLLPDRLLLTELAMYGVFKQVPEPLWFRSYSSERALKKFDVARQHRNLFPGRPPLSSYVPWWLVHSGSLFWNLTLFPDRFTLVRRWHGLCLAGLTLWTRGRIALVEKPYLRWKIYWLPAWRTWWAKQQAVGRSWFFKRRHLCSWLGLRLGLRSLTPEPVLKLYRWVKALSIRSPGTKDLLPGKRANGQQKP